MPIDQIEASQPMYCKMLRILVREGRSPEQIQRSICWGQLKILHQWSPTQYHDPNQIYLHIKQQISA